ncbi:MAG: primosomal protein N' [Oribacterium sp.]|nr:primosomal protein N' [Oribacterium sp.]
MYAQVIIDITNEALDRPYTYHIPEGMHVSAGDRVSIPFGNSRIPKNGYVISLSEQSAYDEDKIKDILGVVSNAISVKEQLIQLAVWMSREYGTTLNQCLKTVLPVKKTVRKNLRRIDPMERYREETDEQHILNPEQQIAADAIVSGIRSCFARKKVSPDRTPGSLDLTQPENGGKTQDPPRYLVFGITGSGKTEVYLHAIEETLALKRKVIMLIPEISLTFQTVLRISSRFRGKVAILHSRMSLGERYEQYMKCERGEVDILVGPRSAIFAPFDNLGLIIMDEEHEGAYKSETAPRYETRDVAFQRAKLTDCPVVYGSATPSLDIFTKALHGEIRLLELTHRAKPGSTLAATEIIDLRKELAEGNRSIFSRRLNELMTEALGKKEQIMLFMNRRGYSSFISCRSCGEAVKCPHCDVSLTLHRDGMLRCHYCGYETPRMKLCPSCGSPYLAPFGFGTERLEEYVKQSFPDAGVLRMDADTTRNKGGHERILAAFRAHRADILIGTQMIVKGHDFPDVTLVGMIAADLSLSAPDFKAQERTFQLITQAAGRAGRDREAGHVIIQTYQPEHYAIQLAARQDYRIFYEQEMAFRKLMGYPPVERLMTIQLQCADENLLDAVSELAVKEMSGYCAACNAELIGPLRATVYRVNDIFRKIIYIKHGSHDIIIQLRDQCQELIRQHDRRSQILLNFDLQ